MPGLRIDAARILLGPRKVDVYGDPFCHFYVDDFLPADVYADLLATFPDARWFVQSTVGNKKRFSSSQTPDVFARFRAAEPLWSELFEAMGSREFVDDLRGLVEPHLVRARGPAGAKPWRSWDSVSSIGAIRGQPIKASFELSRLEPGATVPPHTDGARKLVSVMLYFPDPAWKDEYGGHTEFYRPKTRALADNWENDIVPFDAVSPFHTAKFRPNRLVVFVKSKDSYHGVNEIRCPAGLARNSLNFNVTKALPAEIDWLKSKLKGLRGVAVPAMAE